MRDTGFSMLDSRSVVHLLVLSNKEFMNILTWLAGLFVRVPPTLPPKLRLGVPPQPRNGVSPSYQCYTKLGRFINKNLRFFATVLGTPYGEITEFTENYLATDFTD